MKFECGDLERALAVPHLMPEAREHLKVCATCRREYRLWNEISSAGRELHEEWESPQIWPNIRRALEAEKGVHEGAWWKDWKVWAIAATLVIGVGLVSWVVRQNAYRQPPAGLAARTKAHTQEFLTEQALAEVEKSEAVYRQSIDRLSRVAEPKLRADSSAAMNAREKLILLDSAIADTRANVRINRFNVRLQTTLADLYREKQETLRELVTRDQKN